VPKPTSSLAWISAGNPTRVFALDSLGMRQLDSGAGIDPRSLELNGSTLTWVKAGASRSAALFCGRPHAGVTKLKRRRGWAAR
jgi:hypothetical protein